MWLFLLEMYGHTASEVLTMSEKSFAITSITAAVICGTFFYPPPPATANDAVTVVTGASRSATPPVAPAKTQPHSLRDIALLKLGSAPRAKTVATLAAASPSARD